VFANLTNKTQTLRSAMKTIFSSLVSEVLALLARIVAAKVFGFILKFIPGIGTAAGFALDLGAGKLVGGGSSRAVGTSTGGNINVTIQAMDRSDIYRSLTSPRGELRAAFIEAAATRAY
jgi:hypothetical protein